jgi:hypothetical protein
MRVQLEGPANSSASLPMHAFAHAFQSCSSMDVSLVGLEA